MVGLQERAIGVHPVFQPDVPPRLELNVLDPGPGILHPDDAVRLGGDCREVRVDHGNATWIRDGDAEVSQPVGRSHLDQLPRRRVERLAHCHLDQGPAAPPVYQDPYPRSCPRAADRSPGRSSSAAAQCTVSGMGSVVVS